MGDPAETAEAPEAPPPEESQEKRLAELEAAVANWKGQALRARADYDNLQKRVARDAAAERERTRARVLEGLLAVHELAQMAAHQAEVHPGPLSEGVVLLAREMGRLLEREGVIPIAAVGVPFDATQHEAVAHESVVGVPPGHVARIVQPGYRLDGKVLRYAKVAVAPADGAEVAVRVDED